MEEQLTVSNQNPIAPSPPAPTSPAVGNQPSSRLLGVVLLVVVVAVGGVWAYQSLARSNTPASLLPPSTKSPASEKEESSAPKTSSFGDLGKQIQPSSPEGPRESEGGTDPSQLLKKGDSSKTLTFKEVLLIGNAAAKVWREDAIFLEAGSRDKYSIYEDKDLAKENCLGYSDGKARCWRLAYFSNVYKTRYTGRFGGVLQIGTLGESIVYAIDSPNSLSTFEKMPQHQAEFSKFLDSPQAVEKLNLGTKTGGRCGSPEILDYSLKCYYSSISEGLNPTREVFSWEWGGAYKCSPEGTLSIRADAQTGEVVKTF